MRCPVCLSLVDEVREEFVECLVCASKFNSLVIIEFGDRLAGELN